MTKILFIRPPHIYLPEISAYIDFLRQHKPDVRGVDSGTLAEYDVNDFDVVWHFMGFDTKGAGRYVVHEYNSLSAPPLAKFKNQIKKQLNKKPDRRVFLNETVRKGFGFSDNVPDHLRDMGIAEQFFGVDLNPEYDFVYAGSLYRGNEILKILEYFAHTLTEASICIIGDARADILEKYKNNANIIFTGRVPYEQVPTLLAKGRYGLNLMPDRYPFNVQTATKVLEYCALGLPIVSNRYGWMEAFIAENGGSAFWLDADFKNLEMSAVTAYEFNTPDVQKHRWNSIIASSGVFDFV